MIAIKLLIIISVKKNFPFHNKFCSTSTVCEDSTSLFINFIINVIMGKHFKDFDSEGRFKGVYLSKYLTDEEKTNVRRFAKLDCDLDK